VTILRIAKARIRPGYHITPQVDYRKQALLSLSGQDLGRKKAKI
jgi:hypothetical protein